EPPLLTADQADQVPSGVAVLPLLVSTRMPVPAGRVAVQVAVPQVELLPESKTIELNVPVETYAADVIESATRAGCEPLNDDSAACNCVPAGSVAEIVVFRTPST